MKLLLTIAAFIAAAFTLSFSDNPKNEAPDGAEEYYEIMPDIGSCNAGVLLQSEKDKILNYTNYIRSLHDLKPVEYDGAGQAEATAAALVCAANGALSHDPPADWHCYGSAASSGAANSNLYISIAGNSSQARPSEQSMISWMHDQFTEYVGHRRAIINPFLKSIAFGRVDGKPVENQFYASAMALKYLDNLEQDVSDTDIEYVAFPYRNYPTELVDKNWYLSFSAIYNKSSWSGNNNVDYSQVSITMTADGSPIAVGEIIHDNQGWGGIPNCLKWMVPGLQDGVRYEVEIKNLRVNGTLKDYSYWFVLGEGPKNTPEAPILVAPVDGYQNAEPPVEFSWESSETAETYVLELAKDMSFETGSQLYENIFGTSKEVSNLDPDAGYWWRVAGVNADGRGDWSEVRGFTTKPSPLDRPEITSPTEGEIVETLTPTFDWDDVAGADEYYMQISFDEGFEPNDIYVDEGPIFESSYELPENSKLAEKTGYYVRVRAARTGDVDENWSDAVGFRTYDPASVGYAKQSEDFFLKAYPNPMSDGAVPTLRLPGASRVEIAVYNLSGEKVAFVASGFFVEGTHSFDLDASSLPTGSYFLTARTKFGILAAKVEVAR